MALQLVFRIYLELKHASPPSLHRPGPLTTGYGLLAPGYWLPGPQISDLKTQTPSGSSSGPAARVLHQSWRRPSSTVVVAVKLGKHSPGAAGLVSRPSCLVSRVSTLDSRSSAPGGFTSARPHVCSVSASASDYKRCSHPTRVASR